MSKISQMYKRPYFEIVKKRIEEPRRFIQVISGPRQVGKTTLIHQVLQEAAIPFHFSSADETYSDNAVWIEQQWEVARLKKRQHHQDTFLLIIDEIQKIKNWSNLVKSQWNRLSVRIWPMPHFPQIWSYFIGEKEMMKSILY